MLQETGQQKGTEEQECELGDPAVLSHVTAHARGRGESAAEFREDPLPAIPKSRDSREIDLIAEKPSAAQPDSDSCGGS
jgi:hypothetical protein